MREIVHALEIATLNHHHFSCRKQPFQMQLVRLPVPPAAVAFTRMLKVSRAYRSILMDMLQQLLNFASMLFHPRRLVLPAHFFRCQHPVAYQRKITTRQETGLMGPVLHQFTLRQRIIQPLWGVIAQSTEQHKVGTAGDNIDGIDL
ncbi:hypothetical protein SDC9_182750 [bioreactor metagenome]|uniref:Uncharacterized protein n=1 Tax=bioreactor metagenome TaxID=1076179 RepID=A0A645HHV3_9ZZZZ